jgi:hypothetical protein
MSAGVRHATSEHLLPCGTIERQDLRLVGIDHVRTGSAALFLNLGMRNAMNEDTTLNSLAILDDFRVQSARSLPDFFLSRVSMLSPTSCSSCSVHSSNLFYQDFPNHVGHLVKVP